MSVTFLHPHFFWLLLLLLYPIYRYYFQKPLLDTYMLYANVPHNAPKTWRNKLYACLFPLRIMALVALIIALARPQKSDINSPNSSVRGIDMVMAIDVSGSMLAKDLKPNRMEALKKVATEFVANRPNDRIGLVVYAAESYTKTPITSDKTVVLDALSKVRYDSFLQDGTGIGVGLATAVNRLKDSKAKSKIIILLTDGVNNAGFIDPQMAIEMAKLYQIKVYTIAIGTNGMADFPYAIAPNGTFLFKKMKVEIDQQLMQQIAKATNGNYFRATNNESLSKIYDAIDALETTEIKEQKFVQYDEKFRLWALIAAGILVFEIIIRNTLLRKIA